MKKIAIEFSVIRVWNEVFQDFPGDDDGRQAAIEFYMKTGKSVQLKGIDVIDVNLTAEPWAILDFIRSCRHYQGIPEGLSCGAFVTNATRVRETQVENGVSTDTILDPRFE